MANSASTMNLTRKTIFVVDLQLTKSQKKPTKTTTITASIKNKTQIKLKTKLFQPHHQLKRFHIYNKGKK